MSDGKNNEAFTVPQKRKLSSKPHQYKARSNSKSNAKNEIPDEKPLSNADKIIIDGEEIERLPIQPTPYNSKFSINEICVITHINNPNRSEYIGEIVRITAYYHKRNVYEIFLFRCKQAWNMSEKNLINYDIHCRQMKKIENNSVKEKKGKNPFDENNDERVGIEIHAGVVCRIVNAVKAPQLNGQLCEILEDMTIDVKNKKWRVLLLNNGQDCEFPEDILQATTIKPPSRAPIVSRKSQRGSSPEIMDKRNLVQKRENSKQDVINEKDLKQFLDEYDSGCNCLIL